MSQKESDLVDLQNDFYATYKLIDWFDMARIANAKVLVVGAGAIGNEVLKNLALLGFGNITIVDRDKIEISNLTRSILYRKADCGLPKVEAAAKSIKEINPDININPIFGDIRTKLSLGLIRRMDVVIGCLDNIEGRIFINRACWKLAIPYIDAGIGLLDGQVKVFWANHTPCYECGLTDAAYNSVVTSCEKLASKYAIQGKVPTTPTIASIVAAIQVQEALKLLHLEKWEGRNLLGREFIFNGSFAQAEVYKLAERLDCPAHDTFEVDKIIELKQANTRETTLANLLAIAKETLGETAHIDLNFELAVEMVCRSCKTRKRFLCPKIKLFQEDLICADCKAECYLITTDKIGLTNNQYLEDFLDATLTSIGVPSGDIISARGPKGYAYFELTGDLK